MNKLCYILPLFILGMLFVPKNTFACGNSQKVENCCNTKNSENKNSSKASKDCCKKEKDNCSKHKNGCKGNCKCPSCHCNTLMPVFILSSQLPLFSTIIYLKQKPILFQDSFYAQGFLSIWKPPNII